MKSALRSQVGAAGDGQTCDCALYQWGGGNHHSHPDWTHFPSFLSRRSEGKLRSRAQERSSGRPRQVLFTCGNLWGSRSYFPCPRWRVLHQGSRYRWHSGNSLGGRTSPGPVGSITEAREENQSWHCFAACRQCHLRCDWTRVFSVKMDGWHVLCKGKGTADRKMDLNSTKRVSKVQMQQTGMRERFVHNDHPRCLSQTHTEGAAQTLTMSMIRCPQALHLSADCWKPEYCNTEERLSSEEFQVCQKHYWPQSRRAKSVFNLTVSKSGWVRAVCLLTQPYLETSRKHKKIHPNPTIFEG